MTTKCRVECADQVLAALVAIIADNASRYGTTHICPPLLAEAEAAIAAATQPGASEAAIKGEHRIHGVTCAKVPHTCEGMLHGEDDDRPYDVDGAKYCGRCHLHITTEEIAFAALVARRGVAYCAGCGNTFPVEELRKCANCRPSPTTPSGGQTWPEGTTSTGQRPDGSKATVNLENVAKLAGWPTPDTNKRGGQQDATKRKDGGHSINLQDAAHGAISPSSPAGTVTPKGTSNIAESRGSLNPFFSLYLMGFPVSWGMAGLRSFLKSKKR